MPMTIRRKKTGTGKQGSKWGVLFPGPLVAGFLSLLMATTANPGYYHDLARSAQPCNDCHTIHYSEKGTKPTKKVFTKTDEFVEQSGPYPMLLLRATTNGLCLFCHDGSVPQAPDVQADDAQWNLGYYSGSGDEHSGAGYFNNSIGTANDNGHDLGLKKSSPPFSTMTDVTLTCASCHDPHGTPNYRNILTAPAGGDGVTVEMAKDVFRENPPGDPPANAASIAAYKESNEGYKANTSRWCTECHDELKPLVGALTRPGSPTPNHHIVDKEMNTWTFPTVNTDHWVTGPTGLGFGTEQPAVTGNETEGVPRLRFQVPGATDFATSQGVQANAAANNQVMCTTCHLAHGGKYKKGLVWPYKESGSPVDKNSGCDQCHNGGQQ